jgi:hypothetical protein
MIISAALSIVSLAAAATLDEPGVCLGISLLIGFTSVAVQLLIPLAAHFRSLKHLVTTLPVLRQRSLYQGLLFGSFSLVWTAVPIELTNHYHLSQTAVAVFSLVGAMGATSAPIAGRLADAAHTHRATAFALALAAIGYLSHLRDAAVDE